MKRNYLVNWRARDLQRNASRRLENALAVTNETLDDVIRTMLIDFIEDIEDNGMRGYPHYCAGNLSPER